MEARFWAAWQMPQAERKRAVPKRPWAGRAWQVAHSPRKMVKRSAWEICMLRRRSSLPLGPESCPSGILARTIRDLIPREEFNQTVLVTVPDFPWASRTTVNSPRPAGGMVQGREGTLATVQPQEVRTA